MHIKKPNKINNEIRAREVRLIGIKGEQLGILNLKKALEKADSEFLDLVEINPNAKPPVCRIMNYGKFLYEKNKSYKEQKRKQKTIQIKEIKFRPSTDDGDYQIKLQKLIRFLKNGYKTKITLRFRGREMSHQKIGVNMLYRIKKSLCEDLKLASVESFPLKIEGRQMTMILSPKKK